MGVATGVAMEFEFGTNWADYAHYVGDIFGAPLAIEELMAFFLEASFGGLFFFGWNRLSRVQQLAATCLMTIGTNLSAQWILIANGWMQYPVGARFNIDTMRMEVTSFFEVVFNPVAQAKFVHTVSACYVTGSVFVRSISAFCLLQGRYRGLAIRSMTIAASFGLASALSVVVLGDESGYLTGQNQRMKIAAMEAMWQTEPALVFGVAFGNALQGVPFRFDDALRMTYTGSLFDLFNPFALLAGLVSVVMIVMHGAAWLSCKTEAPLRRRVQRAGASATLLLVVLFALGGLWAAHLDGYVLRGPVTAASITADPHESH
jgi:cytochrome bd-type quinol oxidase subunit 1